MAGFAKAVSLVLNKIARFIDLRHCRTLPPLYVVA